MPAKDIYHDVVKNALIKDGWTVTNDQKIRSQVSSFKGMKKNLD